MGRRAVFSAWRMVPSSTSLAQEMSLSLIVFGIIFSLHSATTEQASSLAREDSNLQSPGSEPGGLPVSLHANSRARWIRTTDLSDPTRVLSQAEPSPVKCRHDESNPARRV